MPKYVFFFFDIDESRGKKQVLVDYLGYKKRNGQGE